MSTDRDTTRIVRSWLEEGVTALPDRVLDAVLDQVPATPQRRSWWPARRIADMNPIAKFAIAAAAVVVIAIVGLELVPRGSFHRTAGAHRRALALPHRGSKPNQPRNRNAARSGYLLLAGLCRGDLIHRARGLATMLAGPLEQGVCRVRGMAGPGPDRDECGCRPVGSRPARSPSPGNRSTTSLRPSRAWQASRQQRRPPSRSTAFPERSSR